MDWTLIVIASLLIFTLSGWAIDWFVYPFGLFVLLTGFIIRLIQIVLNRHHG